MRDWDRSRLPNANGGSQRHERGITSGVHDRGCAAHAPDRSTADLHYIMHAPLCHRFRAARAGNLPITTTSEIPGDAVLFSRIHFVTRDVSVLYKKKRPRRPIQHQNTLRYKHYVTRITTQLTTTSLVSCLSKKN
jgi:hypothetical protein